MRIHPARETIAHHREVRWAMPQNGRHHLHRVSTRQDGFDAIVRMCDPAADGE